MLNKLKLDFNILRRAANLEISTYTLLFYIEYHIMDIKTVQYYLLLMFQRKDQRIG